MRTLAAGRDGKPWIQHIHANSDVAAKAVLYEDSSDVAGWITAAGIGRRLLIGSTVWAILLPC
jgi:hypothetical protein